MSKREGVVFHPEPFVCPSCYHGKRPDGSTCDTCEGTGQVYWVGENVFPRTRRGFDDANRAFFDGERKSK